MSDDIEINLDDPEDIGIAVDDDSPINVEMPEGGQDGRSIHPAGEWSDAVEYAYLDLVTHEGSSYTAVRTVPAGTELTDTYYWQLTAEKGDPGDPGTPEWGEIAGNIADQTDLQTALDAKAPVILNSASGSIASFTDGSPAPVTALTVSIDPVQDLHGYDNPWPAGGGANRFDGEVTTGRINTSTGVPNGTTPGKRSTNYIPVNPTTSYYIYSGGNINVFILEYDINKGFLRYVDYYKNAVYTSSNDAYFVMFYTTVDTNYDKISINYPSTVTTYQPYSNICPISGHTSAVVTRTGKNVLHNTAESVERNGVTFTVYSDGTVKAHGTASANANLRIVNTADKFTLKAETYIVTGQLSSNMSFGYALLDGTSSYWTSASGNTFTLTKDTTFDYIYIRIASGQTPDNVIFKPMIRLASDTDDTYEPYQGTSVTIDLDGTRYGGTLNVLTGEMTVTKGYADLGDYTWTYYTSGTHPVFYTGMPGSYIPEKYSSLTEAGVICSIYPNGMYAETRSILARDLPNKSFSWISATSNILFRDDSYTSASDFETAMSGVQVVYPLKIPLTVQLSPSQMQTILGQNNIWADTGDVAVEYHADTKLYIQKLTKPTEDDMIANNNIAANTFFMVGNSLYYATSAIATGTTIVPGQNCTALSLAEALNNINA